MTLMASLVLESEHGSITISRDVVAEIVSETAKRCYGVVGLTPASRVRRILRRDGISVAGDADGVVIELHVVVEHGLNLAEVAATIRSQVSYDVQRLVGLPVAAVEVVVAAVKEGA
ncbi:MAG: Asp23/Gls24 family envelope stress response protein [Actinobacteria bacterium]|uniref:Unannotated protein n=1 Tax=freshwater metagenome TaxID=449393 RepID=A0A6J6NWA4_9ZZZZ|nr:Asp23/Gls24 family envelope stress response protein [Actinomycetota bacterium]